MSELKPPPLIEVELTNFCNLKCVMCHFPYASVTPQSLDVGLLRRISDIQAEYVVVASGFEPLVHREVDTVVDWLSGLATDYEIITNGTLLTEQRAEKLCSGRIKALTVSFDSIRPAVYEAIRRNSKFEKTLANVAFAMRLARERNVFSAINATYMMMNYEEIPDAVEFWENLFVEQLRCIAMVVRNDNALLKSQSLYSHRAYYLARINTAALKLIERNYRITLTSPYLHRSPLRHSYPENIVGNTARCGGKGGRTYTNPRHTLIRLTKENGRISCSAPFDFAKIMPNGDVQLCYRYTIGSLHDDTFEAIWNGEQARAARKTIQDNPEVCLQCSFRRFCLESTSLDPEDIKNYINI